MNWWPRPRHVAPTAEGTGVQTPSPGQGATEAPPRVFTALKIDVAGREVCLGEQPVMLPRTEFDVLAVLSSGPGMAFDRRQLIEAVWGQTWIGHLLGGCGVRRPPAVPRAPAPRRGAASSDEQFHAEQAYRSAAAISLAVALVVASLVALVVTWYFSLCLQRSVTEVSSAATAVADGATTFGSLHFTTPR